MARSNYIIIKTVIVMSIFFMCIGANMENSKIYEMLMRYGLHRQFVICDSKLFEFFLGAICKHHAVFRKRSISKSESMILEQNQAKSFLKTKKSIDATDDHLNFKDECCLSQHGCDVNEIYGYCNYYIPSVHIFSKKRK